MIIRGPDWLSHINTAVAWPCWFDSTACETQTMMKMQTFSIKSFLDATSNPAEVLPNPNGLIISQTSLTAWFKCALVSSVCVCVCVCVHESRPSAALLLAFAALTQFDAFALLLVLLLGHGLFPGLQDELGDAVEHLTHRQTR